jgi:hypothetical protein
LGWALGEKQEKGLGQFPASMFRWHAVRASWSMYIRLVLCPGWENVEMFVSGDVSCIVIAGGICVVQERRTCQSLGVGSSCVKHDRFLVLCLACFIIFVLISHRIASTSSTWPFDASTLHLQQPRVPSDELSPPDPPSTRSGQQSTYATVDDRSFLGCNPCPLTWPPHA